MRKGHVSKRVAKDFPEIPDELLARMKPSKRGRLLKGEARQTGTVPASMVPPQKAERSLDKVLKVFEGPNARVLIVHRAEAGFSYRLQTRFGAAWSDPGPYVGIYDSAETAEDEARSRVWWLASASQIESN